VKRAQSTFLGVGLMLFAALQWGLLGIVGRVAMAEGAAPLSVAFWRALLGAALFWAHATITRAPALRREHRTTACALGLGGVAVMYAAYLKAVEQGGAALAAILLYSAPTWVALWGWLAGGDRPRRREWGLVGLTFTGVILVAVGSDSGGVRWSGGALGWGLLSGVTYALYYLLGRPLFSGNPPARVLAWALTVGALALAPTASFHSMTGRAWAAVGFLALVCTYGAYLSYGWGLRHLAPARAATIATLEPVLAVAGAYAFWGERLSPIGLAGAAAVVTGVLGASLDLGQARRGVDHETQPERE
jgi:drug/metabolite transporter, DME family